MSDKGDLELTKACAVAMGLDVLKPKNPDSPVVRFREDVTEGYYRVYDPLHDDAQAMALVKRFDLCVMRRGRLTVPGTFEPNYWQVSQYINGDTGHHATTATDLNRAIVECAAKLPEPPHA